MNQMRRSNLRRKLYIHSSNQFEDPPLPRAFIIIHVVYTCTPHCAFAIDQCDITLMIDPHRYWGGVAWTVCEIYNVLVGMPASGIEAPIRYPSIGELTIDINGIKKFYCDTFFNLQTILWKRFFICWDFSRGQKNEIRLEGNWSFFFV